MSTKVAYDALAAERAAREAEGIYEPSPEQTKMLKRRAALVERRNKVDSEIAAIEKMIEKDMTDAGQRALNVGGKNLVLFVPVSKTVTEIDEEAFRAAFPEVVAMHEQYIEHLPTFTTKRSEPNGHRVNYR